MLQDKHNSILIHIIVLTQIVGLVDPAWKKTITSSSVHGIPYATQNAIDGNLSRDPVACECCAATIYQLDPWYQLDFGENHTVYRIHVEGRTDNPNHAHDMVVVGNSPSALHQSLDKVCQYCTNLGLEVDTEKTKIVVFKKGVYI